MVKAKILLQRVWEVGVDWDQDIPQYIAEEWLWWRMELKLLSKKHISRYYFHEDASIKELQLHGFCDASENAYASVVYLRMTDSKGKVHQETNYSTFGIVWSISAGKGSPSCEKSPGHFNI